jgi:putative aldouronate transport system substrate-binding protein
MKKQTRFFLITVVLLFVCVFAFAKGEKEEAAEGKYNEIELVCFELGWTGPKEDMDFVTPEIEKRTGFKIKYEPMTVATWDDLHKRLNLMAASKEIPEAFFGSRDQFSIDLYNKMGQNDLIWEITDFVTEQEVLYPLIRDALYMFRDPSDDSHYILPTQTGSGYDLLNIPPGGPYFRVDWMKELGMEAPTTPEGLYEYCKRVKEEIVTADNGQEVIPYLLNENLQGANPNIFLRHWSVWTDPKNDYEVYYGKYTNSPELMRAAKFWNKMYRDGLMDRQALIIKDAQFKEKVSSSRVGSFDGPYWEMNSLSDAAKQIDPDLMYVSSGKMLDPQVKDPYNSYTWYPFPGAYSSIIFNKKVPEQTVKNFMEMLDYLATEEGQILVNFGIEGESFRYNDNGKIEILPEFNEKTNDMDWNKACAYGVIYWQQLVTDVNKYKHLQETSPMLLREDNKRGWENTAWRRELYSTGVPTKDYFYIPGEMEKKLMKGIDTAFIEMWATVISARNEAEVERIINKWADEAKSLGIMDIVEERRQRIKEIDMEAIINQ